MPGSTVRPTRIGSLARRGIRVFFRLGRRFGPGGPQSRMVDSHCRHEGDEVAAVAAETPYQAADALKESGASKVFAYCTHAVLSGNAIDNLNNSQLDELVVTDTIPLNGAAGASGRIRQLTIADLLAEAMRRVSNEESISALFT